MQKKCSGTLNYNHEIMKGVKGRSRDYTFMHNYMIVVVIIK